VSATDPEAFCERLALPLVRSLTLYCGDVGLGQELAQEALARALEHWPQVSVMDSPEGWAFRTGVNLANSWFRRRTLERRVNQRSLTTRPPVSSASVHAGLESGPVREAVRSLPPRQRQTIIARYFLDLSVDETARLLRCAPGTVKAATAKALAHLRASGLLDDREPEDSL
jgi:RNA polymerase sigma factor (sigma-70 family)